MPDIYYRESASEHSPITGALNNLTSCAGRFCYSILMSMHYLPADVASNFRTLVSPDTLWSLGIVFAGWAIATLIGGVVGLSVDLLLLSYGLYSLYEQLAATWGPLKSWAVAAYKATNDAELEESAKFFSDAVAQGALTVLEVVVTHRVFVKLEGGIRRKFPTPEWLKAEYESRTRAEGKRRPAEDGGAEGRRRRIVEEATKTTKTIGGVEAGKDLAKEFPTGAAVAGGALAVVAVVATTAALLAAEGRRDRG